MDQIRQWMDRTCSVLASGLEIERDAREYPALRPMVVAGEVLVGLESFWLGSVVGQLIARGAQPAEIHERVRRITGRASGQGGADDDTHETVAPLPLYGCEGAVFDMLIGKLRASGYDDLATIELIDSVIELLSGGVL